MGVPKFYRWVSERYPCLSQVVKEHQIPEFDNMYLDMNGIIHPCSHPNDDDPHFRITEEQIFRNIFHYIEILFQIIKPKKVFFMAVDGVAPRAKMNQQRGRRFRSAKEAEDNIRRAIEKGQVLPKEERFDSNCITPGTGFMTRLQEQLKYFVNEKITNDPAWRVLKVYLSGHQTPGEGEHKIMEFIRTERSKPGYDPNTRHCLYGLDADLMMLGLSCHDPHFSLLREEVKFGKQKRIEKPENITFHLLHLSLFREYIDWEFHCLKDALSFPYDLERIIDDWILMGFLVGNDFIPHLPHLHIKHNALPMLYQVYMDVLPTLDGYLHDGGVLNLSRFEKYLAALSKYDREKFDEVFVDMKWFEAKRKHGYDKKPGSSKNKAKKTREEETNPFAALESLSDQLDNTKLEDEAISPELAKLAAALDDDDKNGKETSDEDVFETEFIMFKKQYYREKFEIENIRDNQLSQFVWEYIRGIQWILHYYFNGVQSWGWYYPYHYAPFLSDLTNFSHYKIIFEMGKPFLPFEQLLGVLPAASKQLLPEPLQNLMIMDESPIIDYYPLNFKTDLNGKQQEWEAVVLIPFIDEKRLLDAMTPLYSRLTKEEKERNRHGPFLVYTFDSQLSLNYPSSFPSAFPDIQLCQAKCEKFDRDVLVTLPEKLKKGLLEDVRLDVYFPGFPTLYHIEHTAELKKANVKVFQMHSRWESLILKLTPHPEKDTHKVAQDLLNEVCYVGWPHMVEATISTVSDNTFRYSISKDKATTEDGGKNIKQDVLSEEELQIFNKKVWSYTHSEYEKRGIEVGEVNILIEACVLKGRRFVCGAKGQVTLEKEWSSFPKPFAFQAVAKDIFVHELDSESNIKCIDQLFPIGSPCFMLVSPHYGAKGDVLDVDVSQGRVRVQLKVPSEPNLATIMLQKQSLSDPYVPGHVLSQKLGLSSSLLGRITGKFLIERGSRELSKGQGQLKLDVGLNMKSLKLNKELLGYVKRGDHSGWLFSPAAQKIIMDYTRKFPRLFDTLGILETQIDQIYESDLLSRNVDEAMLQEILEWIRSLPISKQEPMTCGGDILDDQILVEIEKALQDSKKSSETKAVKVRVRPHLLFKPSDCLGHTLPDSNAEFQLFDRVINVKLNSAVPFGLRGTIVGFHQDDDGDEMVEVMFDESFVGSHHIRRTSKSIYLVRPSSFIDLTYGERRDAKKRGQPVAPPRALNKSFAAALYVWKESSRKDGSPHRSKTSGESPRSGRHVRQRSPKGLINNRKASKEPASNPAVTVTRIATPPYKLASTHLVDESRRSTSGNEFANMWKELKKKENSPPNNTTKGTDLHDDAQTREPLEGEKSLDVNDIDQKEKTEALCELLKIGRHSESNDEPSTNPKETKSSDVERKEVGRSLSVEELFRTQATPVPNPISVPIQRPTVSSGPVPSQMLFSLCIAKGQPIPRLYYSQVPQGGIFATVELSNGQKFNGTLCIDQREAMESACAIALSFLNRIGQPKAVQGMPVQPLPVRAAVLPQHVIRVQQPIHPNQGPRIDYSHMGQSPICSPSASLTSSNTSLAPSKSPFIPMQVTRRNLPSKREPSPDDLTKKRTDQVKESTDATPVELSDRLQSNTAQASLSSTVLMTPSSFTECKFKTFYQDGASLGEPSASNSFDLTTRGTKSCLETDSVPGIRTTLEPEKSQSEDTIAKNVKTVNSKKTTPKKAGKKSQRTMAANFAQKK